MKCSQCGKTYQYGFRPDCLPAGVGFVLEDGTRVDVCTDCIMRIGAKDDYDNLINKYMKENEEDGRVQ